ncbi:PREDICTED: uncharacterized protein LOC108753126, partial [Trachymyrmex septentrionalis]|uniref:uncharacterized protein LOC108753126 n=1 Tax=Trachymyrmex septentrionalis TaxID=34720 RepID=UPI00084F3D8F
MKGIYLLTIAFLASWTIIIASKLPIILETEDECPVSNISSLPKLIFHETDCTKYYECKNGQKQLRSCKVGLYFSKRWIGCVTPEISECSPLIPILVPNLECPVLDIFPPKLIPIKQDCTKYYECKNSKEELRICKAGLYFSEYWQGCVSREHSDCPTQDILECPIPDDCPPKLISDEKDCTKYYECKNSKKEPRSCKVGLYFSRYWQGCVNREHSDCLITTQTPIPTTQTPIPTTQTPIPTTQTPIPTTQTPIPTTQTPIPTTQTPIPTTSISSECPYPDTCPPKLIPIKQDCTKYYECKNSKEELRICKAGLYFSEYWQGCVSREHSDCPPQDIPECPIPDDCPPKLISDEKDCTKYYECKNSKKEPRSCKVGLYFSRYWHGCVSRENSDCAVTIPTPISSTPIPGCINGDLLEHECTCTKYYLCIDGY